MTDNSTTSQPGETPPSPATDIPEPVWTFRGYQLRPGEFTTAMVHFFRAEISRANTWRQRLDTTTNWAVVTTGAAISVAFSQSGFHGLFILNAILVTMFLAIEARRYRYYELWSSRVRLMETDFFSSMLVPPFHPSADWAESLAESLLHPHFPISNLEAFGRRLRRNYIWIYTVLGIAWFGKLYLQPFPARDVDEIINRGAIAGVSGWTVFIVMFVLYGLLILFAVLTVGLHEASGEVLPRFGPFEVLNLGGKGTRLGNLGAWFRHGERRNQLLAFVITDQPKLIADRILQDMKRGVTKLQGQGMYTGREMAVLMCALTVTEVAQLKSLVNVGDPNAFVIVTPVQEVLGKGFMPLKPEES